MEQFIETITTPVTKAEVVIKTMITGYEKEQIEAADTALAALDENGKPSLKKGKTTIDVLNAKKHQLLKTCIISINGSEQGTFDALQKMPAPDYEFVFDTIQAGLTKGLGKALKV